MSEVVDPIELLTNKGDRIPSVMNKLFNPGACALAGGLLGCFLNWGFRKPPFSGLQKHFGLSIAGGAIGFYFDGKRNDYLAKRDAVLRNYIELHPEDFPQKKRTKIGDCLDRWVPIR